MAKFVQIAVASTPNIDIVMALDDEGNVFELEGDAELSWRQLPPHPSTTKDSQPA